VSQEAQKALAVLLALGAVVVLALTLGERLLGTAAGPEAELVAQLKKAERPGLELKLPGGERLELPVMQYQRLQVSVAPDGAHAEVHATLDASGRLARPSGEATKVSSLGLERVPFHREGHDWVPDGTLAPRLVALVGALEARRHALETGEGLDGGESAELNALLQVSARHYHAEAWYLRFERDEVLVSEEALLEGTLPDRPVSDRATHRVTVEAQSDGGFRFARGLL
jgi:hypothetical protein